MATRRDVLLLGLAGLLAPHAAWPDATAPARTHAIVVARQARSCPRTSRISPTSTRTRPRAATSRSAPSAPSTASTRSSCSGTAAADIARHLRHAAGVQLPTRRARSGYGHLAQDHRAAAPTVSWVAFELRPEAKFNDGTPVTAEDVAWTFNTLREKGRPFYQQYYARREGRDGRGPAPRGVPLQDQRQPRAAADRRRDGGAAEALVGRPRLLQAADRSAARLRAVSRRHVRVRPHLSLTSACRTGGRRTCRPARAFNFDTMRIEYFRDATVALEAFKAGQIDFRQENIAKQWATAYDFPAVQQGLVKKEDIRHHLPTGMQGFAMNTRRPMFKDVRVRKALAWAYRLRMGQQEPVLWRLHPHHELFQQQRPGLVRHPGRATNWRCSNSIATSCRPSCSPSRSRLPVTDGSGNNREQLRRRADAAASRPAGR